MVCGYNVRVVHQGKKGQAERLIERIVESKNERQFLKGHGENYAF